MNAFYCCWTFTAKLIFRDFFKRGQIYGTGTEELCYPNKWPMDLALTFLLTTFKVKVLVFNL